MNARANIAPRRAAPQRRQRGAILVIALLFLVLLTMLALTSMSGTTLEEKMAGQYRELNLAFQAAEAGLRDAEADLFGVVRTVPATNPVYSGAPRNPVISGGTGFGNASATAGTCSDNTKVGYGRGLCRPTTTGPTPPLLTASLDPNSTVAVAYGQFTNATPLTGVAAPPRYIIEALCEGITPPVGVSFGSPTGTPTCYHRITSRGFGANTGTGTVPQTPVTLQEVYLKPPY
jgi:type IV pilus assembly protein PilX